MKRLKIILFLGLFASRSVGQFYVQPSLGYSFSSHPVEMQSVLITDYQKSVYTMKIKWGENMNTGLTMGYESGDHLFFELDARIAVYARHTSSVEPPDLQSLDNFYLGGFFGEYEYNSPVFQIAPKIGYKVRKDKISAYFGLGPNFMKTKIRVTSRNVVYEFVDWELYPVDAVTKYVYRGGLHTGLQADLGLCYSIMPNLDIVLDFVTAYNNYRIKEGEITLYEINGADRLGSLEDTEIKINVEDNRLNHSYYGINVGLWYVFGRRSQSN